MPRGHPEEITEDKVRIVVEAIRRGHFREIAARLAGISETSLYVWRRKGREHLEQGIDSLYAHMARLIEEADSEAEDKFLGVITDATQTDWKAAQWMMQCRWRKRWGKYEQQDVAVHATLEDLPTDRDELEAQILQELHELKKDPK